MLSSTTLDFVRQHWNDDPLQLLLQRGRYPDVDMNMAAQQIEGRRQARSKWPTLYEHPDIVYPPKINREQSSSEATARLKALIVSQQGRHGSLADLTGGFGIDTLEFAEYFAQTDYVEQDSQLTEIAHHNFQVMGRNNVTCHCADGIEWIKKERRHFDAIYLDPARRDSHGRKVQAFEDCTPNILDNLALLRDSCDTLIVKASPMIDIHTASKQLDEVEEIYIVALSGECKEVLFVVRRPKEEVRFHCIDIIGENTHHLTFTLSEESASEVRFTQEIGKYLYEPNAALMKGGAFRSICRWFPVEKLARNTHLYSSQEWLPEFPGRSFEVLKTLPLTAKAIGQNLPEGRCHLLCKNYVMSTAELQKRLRLKEGGDLHLIATRLGEHLVGILCKKIQE